MRSSFMSATDAVGLFPSTPSPAVAGCCSAARSRPTTRCSRAILFQVESPRTRRRSCHPLNARLGATAGFPSGQRGRAVNPLAQPSQVRILPPPLRRGVSVRRAPERPSGRAARGVRDRATRTAHWSAGRRCAADAPSVLTVVTSCSSYSTRMLSCASRAYERRSNRWGMRSIATAARAPTELPIEHDDALRDAGDDHVAGQPLERRRDHDRDEQDRDPDEGA